MEILNGFIVIFGGPCFLLFLCLCCIFHPIQRLWNVLCTTYLLDHNDGKIYKLVCYEGYDKHSAIVAYVREIGCSYNIGMSDEYFKMEKFKNLEEAISKIQRKIELQPTNVPHLQLIRGGLA